MYFIHRGEGSSAIPRDISFARFVLLDVSYWRHEAQTLTYDVIFARGHASRDGPASSVRIEIQQTGGS